MGDKEPIVFGDPQAPLSVGAFVRWLEGPFATHEALERENKTVVQSIQNTLKGNGDQKTGMEFKVGDMWATSQKVDAALKVSTIVIGVILTFVTLVSGVVSIGRNFFNWW